MLQSPIHSPDGERAPDGVWEDMHDAVGEKA